MSIYLFLCKVDNKYAFIFLCLHKNTYRYYILKAYLPTLSSMELELFSILVCELFISDPFAYDTYTYLSSVLGSTGKSDVTVSRLNNLFNFHNDNWLNADYLLS